MENILSSLLAFTVLLLFISLVNFKNNSIPFSSCLVFSTISGNTSTNVGFLISFSFSTKTLSDVSSLHNSTVSPTSVYILSTGIFNVNVFFFNSFVILLDLNLSNPNCSLL